jgi:DNA-binding CsgD family transcriptional regulator
MKPNPDTTDPLQDRRNMVAQLTRKGMTARDIAKHLGVTPRTIQRDRAAGRTARIGPKPFTPEEHQRALDMLADGASLGEVARTLGRSYDHTCQRYRGMGWTMQQTGQYNSMRKLWKALGV